MASVNDTSHDPESIRQEAYEWIARCLADGLTPAHVEEVRAWYARSPTHAAAYAEARRVWQALGPVVAAVTVSEGARLRSAPRRSMKDATSLARRAFLGSAVAASAAAVGGLMVRPPLGLWPTLTDLTADFHTGAGERRQLSLGTNLTLELNSKTSIAVHSRTSEAVRLDMFAGETSVSVDGAGPPLMVMVETGKVIARQAEFNVRCDENLVSVSCLKGALKVERKNATIGLLAGDQVSYGERGMGAVKAVDAESVTAWRRGLLIFESTPVAQVVAEINRYLPGRIVLLDQDLGLRRMSARLPVAEASKIVAQIEHIFGAKVTSLPGGIILLG